MSTAEIVQLLGEKADFLLGYQSKKIPKVNLSRPSVDQIINVFRQSNRSSKVIANLVRLYRSGTLADTGYLSIFPVDQGLEHTAAYSFYSNQEYFDPENIVSLAVEGGCSAVVSSAGVLGLVAKKYSQKIPFIVKINHSEHLTLPEITDQIMFSTVDQAAEMGAVGIGATVYFGSDLSHRQIAQVSMAIERAHKLGLFAVLWCYPRNLNYLLDDKDYARAVDITAQAIHLGVSMGADIVKQKMPTHNRGFEDLNFSKWTPQMYDQLLTDHPIDLVRYQVIHAYSGKIGLLNSGGESKQADDLHSAVEAAVINKRAGGHGLIMGRKIFKKSRQQGLKILRAVQSVYQNPEIDLA